MLATEKRQVQTAEAHQIKRSGEFSLLSTLANNISEALTGASRMAAEWWGGEAGRGVGAPEHGFHADPAECAGHYKLYELVQKGGYLWEDYLYLLRRGDYLNPNIEHEERMRGNE